MEYISIYSGEEIERILGSVKNKADKELVNNSVSSLEDKIQNKQDTITDLNSIREGSKKGNTSLQPDQVKTINGNSIIGTGNIVIESEKIDLSDYATKNDLDNKMDKVTLAAVATSGSYNDLSNKPTIPDAVTESTVSGWGFTKNTGTVTGVKVNGSIKNPSSGIVDLGTVITTHQDVSHLATKTEVGQKQDKLVSGVNIKTVNGMNILGKGNIEISGGATQYTAEINLITPNFNAVLEGSTGNYIEFTFDTLNENGNTLGEGVTCTYIIVRGSTKKTITERYRYKSQVKFNVDKYLKEGSNDITISIVGNISGASASLGLTFQVVNISMSTTYDVSKVYDVRTDSKIEIPYSVSGTGTKTVEWYVDGVKKDFEVTDEIVEVTTSRTKYINLDGLTQGVHGVQARAYTTINGEKFYSDSVYVDVMVYDGTASSPMTGVCISIPSSYGIVHPLQLHGVEQYVPYTFNLGMYNPTGAARTDVSVYVGGDLQSTIYMSNGTKTEYTFTSLTYGSKTLKIVAGGAVCEIPMIIDKSSANITEITSNLMLNLSATGRTNNDSNKEEWVFGDYHTTFNGFEWSALSGWNNNRLYISGGSDIEVNIAPFASRSVTESGFTMEMEFSTANIENDNAVLCDLRNELGKGLLITASEASLVSSGNAKVSTKYKSGENIRITYVVNPVSGTTYKGLVFIYVNGIISGAVNYASDDNFLSDAILKIGGTMEAEIRLKQIRIYSSALSGDEILNNYILYRDSVAEMMEVYNRNNILDGRSIDLDALASQCPVLMITGDIPTLEATTDKDTTIYVDVDYVNMQDPTRSFTGTHLMMKPQGTSSMGYPKKNYRLYTNKHDDSKLFDADGNQIADRLYSFKEGAQPVDCWCFKADYAESSGTHNTGIAKLWNGVMYDAQVDEEHKLRTEAQNIANENDYPYDVRTTIDGFPCHLVYRSDDSMDWVYIGKYNFNNDKSTESVFGFTGIPNFDNSKMQCWEVLNNGHHLALFQDINNFDTEWKDAFESRYPDTKNPDVSDLKAFATWITTTSDFATEKWQHLDVYKVAAYYVYAMRFGAVDQMVKNSMFTSEDGKKFYFINYDNDTINGLRNDGYLMYPPTITRQSLDESYTTDVYAYAGHDSRLWNYLEADTEFMSIVQTIDASLYNAGLTYSNAIRMFDDEQSAKWCERVYNRDAEYKYISPYVESGTNNLFMLQGSRQSHRKWWLSKRFSFIDSLFVSGEYKSNVVEVKLANAPIGVSFDITAGQQGNYGYGVNNVPISYGIPLEKNEKKTFTTVQVLNVGDPLRIYAAPSLLDVNLGNFIEYVSTLNITGVYTESLGTKLKSLNLGVDSTTSTKRNTSLKVISGLASAKSLETLNIEGYQGITSLDFTELKKLKTLNAFASGLTSVSLFDGSPIELLELPSTIQSISLVNANRIPSSGLIVEDSWKSVTTINIRNCQGLCSDFNIVKTWFTNKTTTNSKCSLTMEGIAWTDVNPLDLISLAALKTDGGVLSLKGTIRLESITLEQIDQIKSLYGDNVFTKGSELFVSAPDTAFVLGAKGIIEGDSLQLNSVVISEYQGSVTWSIVSGSGASISQSGLLTTTETGNTRTIVVQLKHTPTQGNAVTTTTNISVAKAVRPTSVSVNGTGRMSSDSEYTLSVSPTGVNRDYSVDWSINGTAYTDGYVAIKSSDKDSCIVRMINAKGYGKFELTATITMDNGSKLQSTKVIFVGTTLTVNISSNQGTDSTISAIKANVTFGTTTLQATSRTYIHIPVGETIKVSYPKVEGYTQPSDYTFTSTTDDETTSATYSTTIVSVTMSDNQTSLNDISGVKATVKYDSVSTQVATGGTVKVPTGKSVTITWGAVSGYATPATNTFTATGTSMQYEGVYNTTIVTIKMADNQTAYNDIASATATVIASGMTTATVSNNGTAKVPTGASCTITWSAVSGYKTPDKQTFTTSGTSVTKTGTYQTEIVTVNVSSDIAMPSSYTITVSGIGSQTTASKVYKVPFGTSYTVSATAANGYKTPEAQTFTASQASRTVSVVYLEKTFEVPSISGVTDLSTQDVYGNAIQTTTANCYVVKTAGTYAIPLVFGNAIKDGALNADAYTNNNGANSHDFVDYNGTVISSPYIEDVSGEARSAQLSIADTDGIFTDISLVNGTVGKYLKFRIASVPATGANGVLSVKDANGAIMWSWHIWLWADDLSPVEITNNTGVKYKILPVNLASKWDDTAKTKIKNWFYQFGRPNPMLCPSSYNSTSNHASFGVLGYAAASIASNIQTGIKNPATFYKYSSSYNYNWFQTNSGKTYNLWDAACTSTGNSDNNVVKTIYDPCPIGFKMPNGNTFTYFSTSNVVGSFANGWKFKRYSGDTVGVFFPVSGYRNFSDGSLNFVGSYGYVWRSSAHSQNYAYSLTFDASNVFPQDFNSRAYGFSVRPVTDEAPKMPLENGVYIQAVDGTCYTEAEWDGSKTPNGIAVKTDNCEFVMALQDAYTSTCRLGGYEKTVSGIVTATNKSTAQADYAGASNTDTIISELSGYNDSYVTGAPAAEYCKTVTFPNGKKGYLGAAGEWQAALDNKEAIASALSKCGGSKLSNYYWTSTQSSSYTSWYMNLRNKTLYNSNKYEYYYVRAFSAI